jgi:type I restriction enzyme S subunit
VKLGTICSRVTSGGTPSTKRPEYYGGTIPWLRTQEVDFKPIYSTELFITEDGLNNSSAKWIPEKTVIVAMYGATAGRSAITKIALTTNQACCNLIIDEAQADYRFVYYSLRLRYEELEGLAKGSAQTNLNAGIIKEFEIPLPPLPVQRRIADILSEYDDLIENNRRRIAILEETARLTYRKWFGGMEQGKAATLGKICREVRRGVSPDVIAPDTPYIGLEHMPRRSISLCEWESAQKVTSTKLAFEDGDILFGKIRPYFHKVGITFVDGVASSDAIVIKPLRPELHAYVLMTVSSDAFVAAASQGMKEGSKMPRADWKQLLNYSVAMPGDDTLAEFNKVLNPILEQLKTLCFSIRNLAAARDMLLPRLMKGCSIRVEV